MDYRSKILPIELSQLQFSSVDISLEEVDLISRGRFSSIRRAKCDSLPCVGKCLHCLGAKREMIGKIEVECQLICAVKHPCIIQCLGTAWNSTFDRPMILLEYIDETLTQFIGRHRTLIPYYVKVNICSDVALALEYLNLNKIVHGFLSGNNIMMVGNSRAKVTDFWMTNLNTIYSFVRPVGIKAQDKVFIAPESRLPQLRQETKTASDVFSFGVLAIYVDTQKLPNPVAGGSEIERRQSSIDKMAQDSPFKSMAVECLHNNISRRPNLTTLCKDLVTLRESLAYRESMKASLGREGLLEEKLKLCGRKLHQYANEIQRKEREIIERDNQHSKDIKQKEREIIERDNRHSKDIKQKEREIIERDNRHSKDIKRLVELADENKELKKSREESISYSNSLILTIEAQRLQLVELQNLLTSHQTNNVVANEMNDRDQPDFDTILPESSLGVPTPSDSKLDVVEAYRPGIISKEDIVLTNELGEGSGVVYKGTWFDQEIAFKKLSNQNGSELRIATLKYEMFQLCKLTHSNIVMFYGAVLEKGSIGLAMELLTEESLYQLILVNDRQFTSTKMKNTIRQIASGLEYLHSKGVTNCNLKSSNVLFSVNNGIAKIINYGSKSIYDGTTSNCSLIGSFTPRYAAPEILRNDLLSDEKLKLSDMYSLAILIYEVLAAEEPHRDLSMRQLEVKVGREGLRPPIENVVRLSRPVVDIVRRCWDEEAENRPSAKEFGQTWRGIKRV